MNFRTGVSAALLSLLILFGCSEKKSNTIIITKKKPEKVAAPSIRTMGDYNQSRAVEWVGARYTVETRFQADKSLPLASDGKNRYFDNQITLRIVRADGSEFFKRVFSKSFFKEYVDDLYYKDGALLGIVFVRAEGRTLYFAASVGNPDKSSDEYVPLVLRVDNFGNVSVSKDTRLDTESDTAGDEEETI